MKKTIWHDAKGDYVRRLSSEAFIKYFLSFGVVKFIRLLQKDKVCPYCGFVISIRWIWQSWNAHTHCRCAYRVKDGKVKNPCSIEASY